MSHVPRVCAFGHGNTSSRTPLIIFVFGEFGTSFICDHPSHKICNSLSEMNAAFQFDLARPSGHSEGCRHIKLLQPRGNAVRQILHSGMPEWDRLGFTKFQFQLLLSSFAFGSHAVNMANLFVLERTQTQTPSLVMLSCKS